MNGFEPVFDSESELLILGSFPSVLSFQNNFYYGNPRNRFWGLMHELFGMPVGSIQEKKSLLLANNIALWDIVQNGENIANGKLSSSDSNLKCGVAADIPWLMAQTKVDKIICNGKKSFELFCKYYPKLVEIAVCLPSTSPANVRFDKDLWYKELKKREISK